MTYFRTFFFSWLFPILEYCMIFWESTLSNSQDLIFLQALSLAVRLQNSFQSVWAKGLGTVVKEPGALLIRFVYLLENDPVGGQNIKSTNLMMIPVTLTELSWMGTSDGVWS